jgi:hypothetical protein
MKDILIGLAVFGVIFGGAMIGMLLAKVLPDQHMADDTRDAIRIVMAMLATLSAVVLGLLTGSSISSLAEKEGELRTAGVQFIMLDRTLAEYGPETAETRSLLKQLLAERIGQIWPEEGGAVSLTALSSGAGINLVQIGSRFPWAFFVVVVAWLAVIFASFGLYAPRNASVIAALVIAALTLAGPIFMMLEMDQPYGGLVKIPSTSLRVALDQLGGS